MINNNKLVTEAIYKFAIKEEKEWRNDKSNAYDVKIVDEMMKSIRSIGYRYKYLADITHRDNKDLKLLNILLQYIGRFEDEGISAELVGVVGIKGNKAATEIIIKNYMTSSMKNKLSQAVFYDNALNNLKDKRYIFEYLKILKNPEEASRFPFTMIMLGKWQVTEAKPYFLQYIDYFDEKNNRVFISMEALSYYMDEDGIIAEKIAKKLKSSNKDIVMAAKKAEKRLKQKMSNHKG